MSLGLLGQYVMNGVMLGMMYALVAVGFTLFFGVLDIIQFSHGDVLALGAFVALAVWALLVKLGVASPALQLTAVVVVSALATAAVGALVARFVVLPLKGAPSLNVLLVTLMMGTVLREAIRLFYPGGSQPQRFPALLPTTGYDLGGFNLRLDNLLLLACGALLIAGTHLFITRTRLGLAIRAVAQDEETARTMGIDFRAVVLFTFGLGSALAAFAGVMDGLYYNEIYFGMGLLLGVIGFAAVCPLYAWAFLQAESQAALALLVLAGVVAGAVATRTNLLDKLPAAPERLTQTFALLAVVVLCLVLHEDDFSLLLVARVVIGVIACLGLHIPLGYAGVLNFAGASFFGVGGYTAAVLTRSTGLPHLLVPRAGGAMAALIGTLIVVPVLRTRGHYAALVTIAFALLFRTFLEVNDSLGGPQGLKLKEIRIGPWHFNDPVELGPFSGSFYLNYLALLLVLLAVAFLLVQRLERSWIGIDLDAVRLDETAAATFGIDVARWKTVAFTLGNFLAGVAGAASPHLACFLAPHNDT